MAKIKVEWNGKWLAAKVVADVPAGIKVCFDGDKSTTVISTKDVASRIKGLKNTGGTGRRSGRGSAMEMLATLAAESEKCAPELPAKRGGSKAPAKKTVEAKKKSLMKSDLY